ncbi:DNA-binding NarL/FixJ family response regulator [Crossiella equi]|uniref:DNA-binding NarL/FixJ family response regulator n=1 Tax=Crossiella equi TaxID=130796 RepID=A0ABS5A612_9PSEU|nr:response regulator transcription factor [Crossiella equi]MBP2471654.1 DNA-binding NarL/FixJ family response regulator [Crossiella equi]
MTTTAPIRVLLVDDHPVTRAGVRIALEDTGAVLVVGEAGTAAAGLESAAELRPQVVLLDLRLTTQPRPVGLDVLRVLADRQPELRLLVFSQVGVEDALDAIHAGAHGFVAKSATAPELLHAVRAVLAGPVLPPGIAARLVAEHTRRGEGRLALTAREHDVLRCLAKGHDNPEIATALGIAERTVTRHLESIRDKVGEHRRARLVRLAQHWHPNQG